MTNKKEKNNFSLLPLEKHHLGFNPSDDDIKTISEIEKNYEFNAGALMKFFHDLERSIREIESVNKLMLRDCDKKALLKELKALINSFLTVFHESYSGLLIRKELYKMTKLYVYPTNSTYLLHAFHELKFFSDHINSKEAKNKFGNYAEILSSNLKNFLNFSGRNAWLQYDMDNRIDIKYSVNGKLNLIDSIEENLGVLLKRVGELYLSYTKKSGKPFNVVKHHLIMKLFWIYENGTKEPAKFCWNREGDTYAGNFADFLYECAELLIKHFLSPDETPDSLARMAKADLSYYKELSYSQE